MLLVAALASLGATLLGSGAWAASPGPSNTVSAPQGGSFSVSAIVPPSLTCAGGTPVRITSAPVSGTANLFPNGLGPQVPRDANGNFSATITIPLTTPVGSYTIGVACNGTQEEVLETLMVTAATTTTTGRTSTTQTTQTLSLRVTPTSSALGQSVTFSGSAPTAGNGVCPAGDTTQLVANASLFPPSGIGPQFSRDANGNFNVVYKIPAAATPAIYTVGIRCGGGTLSATVMLKVMPATTTTSSTSSTTSTLPSTSSTTLVSFPSTSGPSPTFFAIPTTIANASSSHSGTIGTAALIALVLVILAGLLAVARRRQL
ncbi:MAG TPA: hypothetical protein VHT30_02280 [Acidimicrobiales bacterium]|nr:hypothetical protein [Acidimicrobiales bacterium]